MVLDWLIIGLGNPGRKYEGTLHNAGFAVLDLLLQDYQVPWNLSGQMLSAGLPGIPKALLVKPQTYMNRSGQVLARLRRRYQFRPERCIVLLDNLDLEPGRLRLKFGGGCSSHNGLRSLHEAGLCTDFWRFFIGIGHPGDPAQVCRHVLHKPHPAAAEHYSASLERAKAALVHILQGIRPEELAAEVNRRLPVC